MFEPNDVPLWNRLKAAITAFLTVVWRQGALQGTTAEEAFFVRCGLGETMIQADIDAGLVQSIKDALNNGTLTIDANKIADGVLNTARELLQQQRPGN